MAPQHRATPPGPPVTDNKAEADATDLTCAETAVHGSVRLPYLYPFTGATEGTTTIKDGGSDMYDGGNELRVQVGGAWSEPLKYTSVCHKGEGESAGRGDVVYNTCMLPTGAPFFIAAFSSESSSITGFRVIDDDRQAERRRRMSGKMKIQAVVASPRSLAALVDQPPSPSPASRRGGVLYIREVRWEIAIAIEGSANFALILRVVPRAPHKK